MFIFVELKLLWLAGITSCLVVAKILCTMETALIKSPVWVIPSLLPPSKLLSRALDIGI